MSMSTPIYDDLCETMPGPSGIDEEDEFVLARRDEGDDAAGRNGQVEGDAAQSGAGS